MVFRDGSAIAGTVANEMSGGAIANPPQAPREAFQARCVALSHVEIPPDAMRGAIARLSGCADSLWP